MQLVHALACLGAGHNHAEARALVNSSKRRARLQIILVHADERLDALLTRDGQHPVDEERLCLRDRARGQQHQKIDICDCRADEAVFPG